MKKFALLFIVAAFMTSCSNDAAEKIATEFHEKLDAGDYEHIVKNLSDTETVTAEEWYQFFDIVKTWGPQTNRKNESNYNFKTNNGVTTVKLSYTYDTVEYGKMYERLILIDRGSGYKILTVMMNTDESVVIDGTKEF